MNNLPCLYCEAPVPVWDYKDHIKQCCKIKLGLETPVMPADPFLDRQQAYQRNAMQGHPAWSPEGKNESTTVPDATGHSPDVDMVRDLYRHQREGYQAAVPEGRSRCAWCNGLTSMYVECGNCDGKGWV